MNSLQRLISALALFGTVTLLAQAPAPNPPPAPAAPAAPAAAKVEIQDYSAGFAKLMTLGLPDLAKAQYVQLAVSQEPEQGLVANDYSGERFQTKGNAWLLAEADGTGRFFTTDTLMTREVLRLAPGREPKEPPKDRAAGTWKTVPAAADVAALLKQLRKVAERGAERQRHYESRTPLDKAFLLAALFYSAGLKAEANELASQVFAMTNKPATVIRGALSRLVDGQYAPIVARFGASHNWQAYHDELKALLASRGGVWLKRPQAEKLLADLAAQLAGAKPVLPAEGFTPQQRERATALLTPAAGRGEIELLGEGVWLLLPPPSLIQDEAGRSLLDFLALRRDALPVLLRWLADETLVPQFGMAPSMDVDLGEMKAEMAMPDEGDETNPMHDLLENLAVQPLARPPTRAQVAGPLLAALLPKSDEDRTEAPEAVAEAARAFVDEIKGKDDRQLAWFYLEKGNAPQRETAIRFLLIAPQPDDFARLEKAMLNDPDELDQMFGAISTYVRSRGKAAGPFLDQIEKLAGVQAEPADDATMVKALAIEAGGGTMAGGENYRKRRFQELRAQAGLAPKPAAPAKSLAEVLRGIVESKDEDPEKQQEAMEGLGRAVAGKPRREVVKAVLEAAVATRDGGKCGMLVGYLPELLMREPDAEGENRQVEAKTVTWEGLAQELAARQPAKTEPKPRTQEPRREDEARTLKPNEARALAREFAPQWRQLLGRTDSLAGSPMGMAYGAMGVETLGDMAALALVGLTLGQDADEQEEYAALMQLPDGGRKWWRAAAEAVLADGDQHLPDLPAADHLKPEQLQALLKRLEAAPDATLPAALTGLSDDECLALAAALATDEHQALGAKVTRACGTVRTVKCDLDDPAVAKVAAGLKDRTLTRKLAEELLDLAKQQVTAGRAIVCSFTVRPGFGGAEVRVGVAPVGGGEMFGMDLPMPGVMGMFSAGEDAATAMWPVAKPAAKAAAAEDKTLDQEIPESESSAETVDEFWEKVEAFAKEPAEPGARVMLFFTGSLGTAGKGKPRHRTLDF